MMPEIRFEMWLAFIAAIVFAVVGLFAAVRALRQPQKARSSASFSKEAREDDLSALSTQDTKHHLQFAPYEEDCYLPKAHEDLANYDLVEEEEEDEAAALEGRGDAPPEILSPEAAAAPAAQLRLQEAFELYRGAPAERWDVLLQMGDMYARGAFPVFSPNTDVAEMCYRAAAMCPLGDVAGLAQMKLLELKVAPIPLEDTAGTGLPVFFGVQAYHLALQAIQTTPWTAFQTPRFMPRREEKKEQKIPDIINVGKQSSDKLDSHARVQAEMAATLREREQREREIEEQAERRRQQQLYKQDAQNVHDHAVTQAIDRNLRDLADKFPSLSAPPVSTQPLSLSTSPSLSDENYEDAEIGRTVRDARRAILGRKDIAADVKRQAVHVLDGLSSAKHSKFGKSERESLALVWREVTSDATDEATRGNLVETLAKQLASSIENGQVVCSSGKIARITGALDGVSNQTGVRPLWAVREEIGSLAAKMRDDPAFGSTEQGVHAFETAVRRTYIEELGMSPLILEPVIKEYADAF